MMVGPQGRAIGVEHIPELVASSINNIEKSAAAPLLKKGSLSMHVGGMYLSGTVIRILNLGIASLGSRLDLFIKNSFIPCHGYKLDHLNLFVTPCFIECL